VEVRADCVKYLFDSSQELLPDGFEEGDASRTVGDKTLSAISALSLTSQSRSDYTRILQSSNPLESYKAYMGQDAVWMSALEIAAACQVVWFANLSCRSFFLLFYFYFIAVWRR
jgi:hypothetical protein